MAIEVYTTYNQTISVETTAQTYYDLEANQAETLEHKRKIHGSAVSQSAYSATANKVSITFYGVPNLANASKFSFDESNCSVLTIDNQTPDVGQEVHLNADAENGVKQLFGKRGTYQGNEYYCAFDVSITKESSGIMSLDGNTTVTERHLLGCFGSNENYSYDEETRTLTLDYVAVRNSPSSAKNIAPIEITFSGVETWVKTYDIHNSYWLDSGSADTISVHLGKRITNADISGFKILYNQTRGRVSRNGYLIAGSHPDSYLNLVHKNVDVSDLRFDKPNSDTFKIEARSNIVDSNGKNVFLSYTPTVVGLSSLPFSAFVAPVTAYQIGDTIDLDSIASSCPSWENAYLTFQDGEKIHLSEVDLVSGYGISATMSVKVDNVTKTNLRVLPIELMVAYSNCSITLTIPTLYYGTLTFTYNVDIESTIPQAVRLENVKTDFVYGETLVYGSSAIAKLFDNAGHEITVDDNAVSALLAAGILISDPKIAGNDTAKTSSPITIETALKNSNYYRYSAYVSYCDSFALSEVNLGTIYVNSGESTSIASLLSTVTARYVYHHNTASVQETENKTLANSALTPSISSVQTDADILNQKVTFTATPAECANQTLSTSASFNVIVNRFTSLQIEHAATGNTYYAGRDNTFVIPSDLVVKKLYNNPTLSAVALSVDEVAALEYRLSEGTASAELTALSSTIPSSTKTIYVTLELTDGTILQGSFSIAGDYQPDPVTAIKFGQSFSFKLGNKPSKYKDSGDCILIAHYASGHASNLTTEIFDDYLFVQKVGADYLDYEAVVMASGGDFFVKHNGTYYQVGYEEDVSITYTIPTGSISVSGYQRSFINNVDPIDFTSVNATITYADADESTTVEASLSETNVASTTEYALSCTGVTDFDGSEAFAITSEGTEFTRTFTITAKNRFDNSATISSTFDTNVIALAGLAITRLAVRNPKSKYKVGETFLSADDPTLLDVFYSGSSTPITVYLKDVPSLVGTDPSQGTVFNASADTLTVTVRLLSNTQIYTTYISKVEAVSSLSKVSLHNIVAVFVFNGETTGIEKLDAKPHYYRNENGTIEVSGWYVLVDESNTEINSSGARQLKSGVSIASIKKYGYIEDAFNTSKSARVILFDDYVPPVMGESNIEVKFPCYVRGAADKINKCRIGKLFGNSNAKNRLFLAGNPDLPNCDWHSGRINESERNGNSVDSNGDFTYFGDMDYCFYGQTDNAIMGYDHVATDKMVVLKSKSKVEPTNYFRTSSLIQAIDAGGNAVNGVDGSQLYAESFPLATGNVGEGVMNFRSIVNLNGDTLYVSCNNAICGLNIAGQVGDSQRIAYSRSRLIDPELKGLDLSDCVLWTDNKYLMLFAKDATYMTHYETFSEETQQYEWWKMDVKGVRCAIEIDGTIYLGGEDGSLYSFSDRYFYDCDKIFIEAGGALYVTLDTLFGDDKIVYAQDVNSQIDHDGDYVFTMRASSIRKSLFRKVASISNSERPNVDLLIDYDANVLRVVALDADGERDADRYAVLMEELSNEDGYYLNHADGESSIDGEPGQETTEYFRRYKVVPTDDDEGSYRLLDTDGNVVQLSRSVTSGGATMKVPTLVSANLCRVLDGEYEVCDLDKEDCSFRLKENGRGLDIIRYGGQDLASQSFEAELHLHKPVKSYFVAAPAVLGGVSYRKTIWSWTLSAFNEPNDLKVCQATNEENMEAMRTLAFADKVPIGTDFKGFSFSAVDFGKDVVPRKFTYFRPISVSFISLGFKSEEAANSILTATSIVYTIPTLSWGSK